MKMGSPMKSVSIPGALYKSRKKDFFLCMYIVMYMCISARTHDDVFLLV